MLDIKNSMRDGSTAIRTGLDELENAGYIVRGVLRSKDGKFSEWVCNVYERAAPVDQRTSPDDRKQDLPTGDMPLVGYPLVDFPLVDFPQLDNPDLENREVTNNDSTNIESINKDIPALRKEAKEKNLDIVDGMLYFAGKKREREKAGVIERVFNYPVDVQDTIAAFCNAWEMIPPAKKTPQYKEWIKVAREINANCADTGVHARDAIMLTHKAWLND